MIRKYLTGSAKEMAAQMHQLLLQCAKNKAYERCLIHTERAASGLGLFIPTDAQKWGAPEGQQRGIPYSLCRQCLKRSETNERAHMDKIEAVLESRIKEMPWQ